MLAAIGIWTLIILMGIGVLVICVQLERTFGIFAWFVFIPDILEGFFKIVAELLSSLNE